METQIEKVVKELEEEIVVPWYLNFEKILGVTIDNWGVVMEPYKDV